MPQITNGYGLDHAYKFYKNKFKGKPKFDVTKKDYRAICCDFNKLLVADVLDGKMMNIPHSLGTIWAKKFQLATPHPSCMALT